ncbi:hypothetical protein [Wenzhouxiangella marina]|uniref:Uncharacterized protein n=1 Tax=Wenzhouxiangella marina TaxID=1579979 RepID=A0A0K0XW36_9GAMM|nr:hypothetical protein [Wenzhouxiangella marina]AKS41893.1 hypothetical protein WM2015_1523 [Wenzhouxiangella marina]MBB6086340.1 hypothetical protein [Wenzhouxiangella marina]
MNRKIILLVFGMFTLPVVIAVLLNSRWVDWEPGGTRNHGEFVDPVVPLPENDWTSSDGTVVARDDLLDLWQLTHVRRSACDQACMEDLYWLRQTRMAQDRHVPEVGLLLISAEPIDEVRRAEILALSEQFRIIDGAAGAELIEAFPGSESAPLRYIIDPMGNIMMRYPGEADPNGIRRDLHRLLTWTQRD